MWLQENVELTAKFLAWQCHSAPDIICGLTLSESLPFVPLCSSVSTGTTPGKSLLQWQQWFLSYCHNSWIWATGYMVVRRMWKNCDFGNHELSSIHTTFLRTEISSQCRAPQGIQKSLCFSSGWWNWKTSNHKHLSLPRLKHTIIGKNCMPEINRSRHKKQPGDIPVTQFGLEATITSRFLRSSDSGRWQWHSSSIHLTAPDSSEAQRSTQNHRSSDTAEELTNWQGK